MLAPNSRLMLLECLRPPTGFTLDAAVGTTYTLALDALLIPPAAWAVHNIGDRLDRADPILLANSLRLFAERTVVFHQAGAASTFSDGGGELLSAFLDEMVFPVRVGSGETFHPKVWVLRFTGKDGDKGLRVLVGSRNLSLDATWDVLVTLDSGPKVDGAATGVQLANMLRSLPSRSTVTLPPARRNLVESLAADLAGAYFTPPDRCTSAELLWWSPRSPLKQMFPSVCRRRLVISPFLGSGGLNRLPTASEPGGSYLVSRQSSIDSALAAGFDAYTLKTDMAGVEDGDEARLGNDLHAKVFAFDTDESSTLIIGSANATAAAFTMNDEVVVRLIGSTSNLGVNALLGEQSEEGGHGAELELIDVLESWSADEEEGAEDDDSRFFETAIHSVASLQLSGTCSESAQGRYALALRLSAPVNLPTGLSVEFALLGQAIPLPSALQRGELVALDLELEALTRFVIARFSDRSGVVEAVSVVLIADVEMPAGRARRALRQLLTNREKFGRFLRYLLESGQDPTIPGEGDESLGLVKAQPRRSRAVIAVEGPILEQLLRLLASRPSDLRQLDAVIKDFGDDEELFLDGFVNLWKAIAPLIPGEES